MVKSSVGDYLFFPVEKELFENFGGWLAAPLAFLIVKNGLILKMRPGEQEENIS